MIKITDEFIPDPVNIDREVLRLCEDAQGKMLEKGDKVEIKNHSNLQVNGADYMILRRWEMNKNVCECVRENNGIVTYVAVHQSHIFKRKEV